MKEKKLSEKEKSQAEPEVNLSDITSIYQIVSEDNRVYNNIVWQFPTALIAANGLMLQALNEGPAFILLIVSILNFGLIHALFKLSHNQHAIIEALQRTEKKIKEIQNSQYKDFLPDYGKGQSEILKLSSRSIINYMLLAANIIYFGVELIRTISEIIHV